MKSFIADKNRKLSKLALYNIEDLSYTSFMRALRKKDVKVNGKRVSKDVDLLVGDVVEIYYQLQEVEKYTEIFKDQNILVINKKSGYTSESVYEQIKKEQRDARFIHRLDRNTAGVMIFALNESAEKDLLNGFKNRTFNKKYQALVVGVPKIKSAILTAYLLKDKESATVRIYDNHVKGSVEIKTGYKVIKQNKDTSILEVELFTGKTHQIRAHLAHIGYPIVGDGKYGDFSFNEKLGQKTQNLTATELKLSFNKDEYLSYLDGKTFIISD